MIKRQKFSREAVKIRFILSKDNSQSMIHFSESYSYQLTLMITEKVIKMKVLGFLTAKKSFLFLPADVEGNREGDKDEVAWFPYN